MTKFITSLRAVSVFAATVFLGLLAAGCENGKVPPEWNFCLDPYNTDLIQDYGDNLSGDIHYTVVDSKGKERELWAQAMYTCGFSSLDGASHGSTEPNFVDFYNGVFDGNYVRLKELKICLTDPFYAPEADAVCYAGKLDFFEGATEFDRQGGVTFYDPAGVEVRFAFDLSQEPISDSNPAPQIDLAPLHNFLQARAREIKDDSY